MEHEVWTDPEDRKYCGRCIYYPESSIQQRRYLCEYFLRTGKLRGCKGGKGCTKRVIKREG